MCMFEIGMCLYLGKIIICLCSRIIIYMFVFKSNYSMFVSG